ncbi:MAG: hypothetical protein ACREUR_02850, partial [Nitrosospira sp.]
MVAITMKVPENKNWHRAFPAATAMLLLSSYSYGQALPPPLGLPQLGQPLLGQPFLGQPLLGQPQLAAGRDVPPEAAGPAGWRILPRLNLRETISDNVRLRQESEARGDFVTQI